VVGVIGACEGDIVEDVLAVEAEALSNGNESLWSEGSLSVDVEGLAFCATLVERKLKETVSATLSNSLRLGMSHTTCDIAASCLS